MTIGAATSGRNLPTKHLTAHLKRAKDLLEERSKIP
jgi:hypothetical protein